MFNPISCFKNIYLRWENYRNNLKEFEKIQEQLRIRNSEDYQDLKENLQLIIQNLKQENTFLEQKTSSLEKEVEISHRIINSHKIIYSTEKQKLELELRNTRKELSKERINYTELSREYEKLKDSIVVKRKSLLGKVIKSTAKFPAKGAKILYIPFSKKQNPAKVIQEPDSP